jgi:hypothetical protein
MSKFLKCKAVWYFFGPFEVKQKKKKEKKEAAHEGPLSPAGP